jgi:D-3-phosphoglycerate dehydrogenase / 2-oxoglutarate reductase
MKILVADPLSKEGIDILRSFADVDVKVGLKPDELVPIIGEYEALVVRSQPKVTAKVIEAGKKLQVIGRAGVGVDNIDVETATRLGIIVVNAPTGNIISAAEHTIALMLSLARFVPQANAVLKSGVWKKSEFTGVEMRKKTLGIIGLGNVGSEVARRARGLEMKLIAYDSFVSQEYARNLQVELVSLEQLLKDSDFITLHLPLTASTRGMIGAKELALVKPTVRIINTARGGLIDEEELAKAVREKRVAGAAVDVFAVEPCTSNALFEESNIIVTPHLGASTAEAQVMASTEVARQVVDVLKGQPARYMVNAPFVPPEMMAFMLPFLKAATIAGKLVGQLGEGQMHTISIKYEGEISTYNTDALKAAALEGLLEEVIEERVNLINANFIAAQRGLKVVEQKESDCEHYASLISLEATTDTGKAGVMVTVMRGETHIVKVNDYWVDIVPTGAYFLFSQHLDKPGMIGAVGSIAGNANVNISAMHLGRVSPRGEAMMILALDDPLPEAQRQQILALPGVTSAKVIKL